MSNIILCFTAVFAKKQPFADSISASHTPVGIGFGYKPFGGYAAKMGIRELEAVGVTRTSMAQNPKFLVCRSCGLKPPLKRVRRRCPRCGEQMRVDRDR